MVILLEEFRALMKNVWMSPLKRVRAERGEWRNADFIAAHVDFEVRTVNMSIYVKEDAQRGLRKEGLKGVQRKSISVHLPDGCMLSFSSYSMHLRKTPHRLNLVDVSNPPVHPPLSRKDWGVSLGDESTRSVLIDLKQCWPTALLWGGRMDLLTSWGSFHPKTHGLLETIWQHALKVDAVPLWSLLPNFKICFSQLNSTSRCKVH